MRSDEVAKAMARFYEVRSKGDLEGFAQMLAEGEGVHVIGTAEDEWIEGRDQWLAATSGGDSSTLGTIHPGKDLQAFEVGEFGWAIDRPSLHLPSGEVPKLRVTAIFRKQEGTWRLVVLHASVGSPE